MIAETTTGASSQFAEGVRETFLSVSGLPDSGPAHPPTAGEMLEQLTAIASQAGFEVLELLGQGGMGAVALARDIQLDRRLALKFLHVPIPEDASRLKLEAERTSRLSHENIVQVYSWHTVGEIAFFAMEYVDGENLAERIRREPSFPVTEVLRIIAEACAGVEAAHQQGILHRDIKPQNILISRTGRVKVADFGLASTMREQIDGGDSAIGTCGTFGFMAPEQARGEAVSTLSDVFSIAATLYYAIAFQSPFGKGSIGRIIKANRQGAVMSLRRTHPNLPDVLHDLLEVSLSPLPRRRPSSVGLLRKRIENAIMAVHEHRSRSGFTERFRKEFRRKPFLLGVIVGLILSFVIRLLLPA